MFVNKKIFITNKVNGIKDSNKLIEKYIKPKIGKQFNLRNLKNQNFFMFRKLAKLKKQLSNNGNLPKFDIKKLD